MPDWLKATLMFYGVAAGSVLVVVILGCVEAFFGVSTAVALFAGISVIAPAVFFHAMLR